MAYPDALARLLAELEKLPGIGPRTAERLANHLIQDRPEDARDLAHALAAAVESIRPCSVCCHVTESDPCPICSDPAREQQRVLVVEQPRDLEAMERAGWRGVYHVLRGSVRADGSAGGELTLERLRRRLADPRIEELVLGTDPDLEGDGTALVIAALVEKSGRPGLKVSRLARGVPSGSAIEYSNPAVLAEALAERRGVAREGGVP
jgi:recombination protein RecR